MATPLLQLTGVERSYGQDGIIRALAGVDLEIESGDYLAVTGRSGSGKSTLLNILGLLERPSAGQYLHQGVNTSEMSTKRLDSLRASSFGIVFQAFHLVDYMTVYENVALGLTYTGWSRPRARSRIEEVIEQVGVGHRVNARTNTLSGGERQRVAIARTLARGPEILLADEPTGNLDEANSDAVLGLFEEIHAAGVTLIVVTHDSETAARAHRRIHMRDGRVDGQT